MEQVAFNELYSLMNIAGIIIVEDSMDFDLSRTAIMYDYLLLTNSDKEILNQNISNGQTKDKLCKISEIYYHCKDSFDWDKVPRRDIEYYLRKEKMNLLEDAIENLTEKDLEDNKQIFQRFGLGVKVETEIGYGSVLNGARNMGERLPLRIYTDFLSLELKWIEEDIKIFSEKDGFFLCIIDNFINGEARGKDVIDSLNENTLARKRGICITLSSQQEDITKETEEMYVGFVNKAQENIDDEIKKHLIMSQYKIMLTLLKEKRISALEKSFSYAESNMGVAVFLAAMAKEEGITNHEILNEWINLREQYYTYREGRTEIKRSILLSSLFERIETDKNETIKELDKMDVTEFQTFEQYDYHVNEFLIPPMTGDIFYIKGKYYLLVGQECDLSIRKGERHSPIAELIPVQLVKDKDLGNCKEHYNFEKLLLGGFLNVEGQCCNISIDYTKRVVIDNEILDLCAFNENGESEIRLERTLEVDAKYLLPREWQQYYESLQKRLISLRNKYNLVKKNEKILGFNVAQLVQDMGASHNNRLVSIIDFSVTDDTVKYDVMRVCRIRNHVLLINKMYLEYRGRQAFNTINMDVGKTLVYTIELAGSDTKISGKNATVIFTTSRSENKNIKRRDWVIDKKDILQIIKIFDLDVGTKYEQMLLELDEKLLLKDITGNIGKNAIKYTKQLKGEQVLLKIQLLK